MPGQNRTGPNGYGPLTGRGLGYCGGGIPRRCNRGYGFRRQVPLTKEEEKEILKGELKGIESEKQGIEKRLKEID